MTKQQTQTWGWQRIFNAGLLMTTYLLSTTTKKFSSSVGSIAITSWASLSVLQAVNADNSVNLQAGLVAYYPFNGNANDESGHGLDGTVYGATLTTDRFGNANKAYSFDGISNYIKIGDPVPSLLQIQNSLSISAWIHVTSFPGSQFLAIVSCQYEEAYGSGASIYIFSNGRIHFQIGHGAWYPMNTHTTISINQWAHIVATRNALEDANIYFNGILQPVSASYNNVASGSELWHGMINYMGSMYAIGRQKDLGRYFKGNIDDIRIYNRALDPAEVLELYSEGVTINLQSGLVAYYPFNGNAKDESGNNHHGIVMGATLTTDRFGNANKAYYFDGALTTYIKASASHLPTKDRTISLWINAVMPSYEHRHQIVLAYGGYNSCNVGNSLYVAIRGEGQNYYDFEGCCNNYKLWAPRDDIKSKGKWIHLAYTTSLRGSSIYINGVLSANDKNIYLSNTFVDGTDLAIGANILPEGLGLVGTLPNQEPIICNFIGSLDDIRIYNRSITESEVKALYQETAPASIEPPPVITPQTSLPKSANTNLALAVGLSAGLTSGVIVTTALLWKYYKNKKAENKLEEQHFANQIRKLLNLDINNFESTEGKDFIRMIDLLKSHLLEKDINVNNMTAAQQNELAKAGATVIRSQSLLVESTSTGCLNVNVLFGKQNKLLHEQFQSRVESIVNDILNEINNKYTLTKHSVEPVILSSIVIEVSSAQLLEHLDRLVGSILSNLIKKGFWLSTNNEHYKTIFKDSLQSSGLFKDYCLLDDLKRSYIRELLVVNITKEFLEIAKVTDNMQALQSTIIDAFEKVIRNEGQLLLEANSKQHSSDADESEKLINLQPNIEVEMHQKPRPLLFIDRQNNISPSTKEHQTLSDDKPARIIRRRKLSL